ncbi:MAG: hypothetical protein WD646_03965 [Actinomycetota bacterium]
MDDSRRVSVIGRVQDDFLYSGTVKVGGRDLYQMVVSDDAVALRLIDLAGTQRVIDLARTVDVTTADALAQGRWVIDHTAAPALRASGRQEPADDEEKAEGIGAVAQVNPIGDDPFFDAASVLQYAERSFRAATVARFNPEDIEYNPADDPWRSDSERELEDQGIRRFDIVQPFLPSRAERGQQQRLPSLAHFRKMVVYLKGEDAIEVQEQVSLADRKEFRRAEVGRTAQYNLKIRDDARRGAIAEPLRERRMVFRVEEFEDVTISLPRTAEPGLLREVLGEGGLKSLFDFKTIGGGPAAVLPTSPLPTNPAPTSPGPSVSPGIGVSPSPVTP